MGAQTGDFLVGHGASAWIKKSTENGKGNGGIQSLKKASFVPNGLIVNKVRWVHAGRQSGPQQVHRCGSRVVKMNRVTGTFSEFSGHVDVPGRSMVAWR